MNSEQEEGKPTSSDETAAPPDSGASEPKLEHQLASHRAALDAARAAEEAVANSAFSPGLGQRDQPGRIPTRKRS